MDDQRRLRAVDALSIQRSDIRSIVHRFSVLENVDVVGDLPVRSVHSLPSVEEDSVAFGQRLFGEGCGIRHVCQTRCIDSGLVYEQPVDVNIATSACVSVPIGVFRNVGLQSAQRLGTRTDVGAIGTAVELHCGVYIGEGLDIRDGVQIRRGVDVRRVRAVAGARACVGVDDRLEDDVGERFCDLEEWIPRTRQRVDVERHEDEAEVDQLCLY